MAQNVTYETLSAQIKQRKLGPVYVLHGAEGYFIDQLVKEFQNVLPPEEADFNRYIFYPAQTPAEKIIDAARSFPMMSDRQVVIVKEMQSARADQINKFASYIENPSPSTIFVLAFRGADAKGEKLMTALKKSTSAVVFQSKPIRDYNMGPYITEFLNRAGLNVQPKALEMLKEYIGTDLARMHNETSKLISILGKGATVTPESVEHHIGISKDYNLYELVDAIAIRDSAKVMKIAAYIRANPKAIPIVMVPTRLFAFFSDLLVIFSLGNVSETDILRALKMRSAFQLKPYNAARKLYSSSQVFEIITAIRRFDAQSKGIGSRRSPYDLLDELLFRILTAPGRLITKY